MSFDVVAMTFLAIFGRSCSKMHSMGINEYRLAIVLTTSPGGAMLTNTTIHPSSFLAHLSQQELFLNTTGKELLRQIPFLRWDGLTGKNVSTTATIVSVDNGNDAFKGAMLHAHLPQLRTRRIITAYAPAAVLRAGEGITTWQVNESEPFWIGEDALLTAKAESLPIGMTEERLPDERYRHFLFACLIELLREAGYETPDGDWQGEYDLYLSFGVPNEEINRSGVKETAHRALQHIYNVLHTVRRTDEQGQVATWRLRIVELDPYPQTFGSFLAWYYTPDGAAIETDIVKHVTMDIGGGQFHTCTVTLEHQNDGKPRLRMEAALLDEGTIALARAVRESLRTQYPGVRLSDAEAQRVLVSEYVTIGGRRTNVHDLVSNIIHTRSQKLLIPISVLRDHSKMREVGQRTEIVRISFQLVESLTHFVNHGIKRGKSEIRELFFTEFFPHMLNRIELRTVSGLSDEPNIFRDRELFCEMPPRLIHLHHHKVFGIGA